LSCFYIDGFAYQENELVAQNVADGHDVIVIASTESFDESGHLTYKSPGEYVGTDGARVIRIPYRYFLPTRIMAKLRLHPGVYKLLMSEMPDAVFFHGLCGWELLTVARYKRNNSRVRLLVDSHEDFHNSARTFLSKNILHRLYYKNIIKSVLDVMDSVLCVSHETMDFVEETYGLPRKMLSFFPLGGRVFADDEYSRLRNSVRQELGLLEEQVVYLQSGKIDRMKKLVESLNAFTSLQNENLRFLICGTLHNEVTREVMELVDNDSRIRYLGWKSADELRSLLCAADVYVQPGTQSATMQMSLCCRCAVILDDVPSHHVYVRGNGWLVKSQQDLVAAVRESAGSGDALKKMASVSAHISSSTLDYARLAKRVYAED
tara:strand:+ start:1725 stop:2855 length:1131 start_codon:yes stop_codon:yes gene_type:complete